MSLVTYLDSRTLNKYNLNNCDIKKSSRGEICVTNVIPPPPFDGASLGSYFCVKNLTSIYSKCNTVSRLSLALFEVL